MSSTDEKQRTRLPSCSFVCTAKAGTTWRCLKIKNTWRVATRDDKTALTKCKSGKQKYVFPLQIFVRMLWKYCNYEMYLWEHSCGDGQATRETACLECGVDMVSASYKNPIWSAFLMV